MSFFSTRILQQCFYFGRHKAEFLLKEIPHVYLFDFILHLNLTEEFVQFLIGNQRLFFGLNLTRILY